MRTRAVVLRQTSCCWQACNAFYNVSLSSRILTTRHLALCSDGSLCEADSELLADLLGGSGGVTPFMSPRSVSEEPANLHLEPCESVPGMHCAVLHAATLNRTSYTAGLRSCHAIQQFLGVGNPPGLHAGNSPSRCMPLQCFAVTQSNFLL